MFGEQQTTMPSFTPNPNPDPPQADSSPYQYSHGFDGLGDRPAFEVEIAAASQNEIISQTTDPTTYEHAAGNQGDVTQSESIRPMQCEVCNVTCNSTDILEKHKQGKKHLKNMQKLAITSVIAPNMPPPPPPAATGGLEDKKHNLLQNGAAVENLLHCETCNVVCNNQEVFQKHLAGKKHSAKAIMQLASTNGVFNATSDCSSMAEPPSGGGSQKNLDIIYPARCELCKISCTSIELLNLHMAGKKHLKKLKDSEQIQDSSVEGKSVISQEGNPVSCELCGISCNTYDVLKAHISGKKHQKKLEQSEKGIGPAPAPAQDLLNEEGKIVNVEGSIAKGKRKGSHEDVEAKKQKVLESGAASDALRTCTVCNVVCSSPTVYISHLAGRKHAAMAVKQAETGLAEQET